MGEDWMGLGEVRALRNGDIKKRAYHFAPETLRNGAYRSSARFLAPAGKKIFAGIKVKMCGNPVENRC